MAMNIINLFLFPGINVMIIPCCVIYSSNRFKALCRMTVRLRSMYRVRDNWFLSMDAIRSFISKTQAVDKTDYPASTQYGRDNLIPFLNYVDVQNYIKRLRKHLSLKLGSYEPLHFYAVPLRLISRALPQAFTQMTDYITSAVSDSRNTDVLTSVPYCNLSDISSYFDSIYNKDSFD